MATHSRAMLLIERHRALRDSLRRIVAFHELHHEGRDAPNFLEAVDLTHFTFANPGGHFVRAEASTGSQGQFVWIIWGETG